MILYFSSTGNCQYVARRLADALQDRTASITDVSTVHLAAGERLGFVFPTYFWRLPSLVDSYMKSFSVTWEDPSPYVYFIATYGSTCGGTGFYMKRWMKRKGLSLSAAFSIKTVDDWTVWFDASNEKELGDALAAEEPQIAAVTEQIRAGVKGKHMKNTLPMIAVMGSGVFYDRARRTKHLHVLDSCIGCGLCEKECPTGTISLRDGKPIWTNDRCAMCLHCLHHCPSFAIQYDDKTQTHGQYRHP